MQNVTLRKVDEVVNKPTVVVPVAVGNHTTSLSYDTCVEGTSGIFLLGA